MIISPLSKSALPALREKQLPPRDLAQVTVDTTVQPKNITHLTDAKLLHTAAKERPCPAERQNRGLGSYLSPKDMGNSKP